MKFWNNEHPLTEECDRLFELLVPDAGKSDYLVGECLRAASRIYYDHYNNGSCNNVTGAWNFLDSKITVLMSMYGLGLRNREMKAALLTVAPYMNCNGPDPSFEERDLNDALDLIVENVVMVALAEEQTGNFTLNDEDIFEYEDDEVYTDDEDSWL